MNFFLMKFKLKIIFIIFGRKKTHYSSVLYLAYFSPASGPMIWQTYQSKDLSIFFHLCSDEPESDGVI